VLRLIDELFVRPAMTAPEAAEFMGISSQGARGVFDRLASAGIVEVLPNSWPTLYVARELIALIEAPTA
jgi:predicted ArsR family transcriptional regulator